MLEEDKDMRWILLFKHPDLLVWKLWSRIWWVTLTVSLAILQQLRLEAPSALTMDIGLPPLG